MPNSLCGPEDAGKEYTARRQTPPQLAHCHGFNQPGHVPWIARGGKRVDAGTLTASAGEMASGHWRPNPRRLAHRARLLWHGGSYL